MLYEKVFKELQKNKVRYLVIDGIAVNLHGLTRATSDLDLFMALDEKNLKSFVQAMKALGYKPRMPVPIEDLVDADKREDWISNKNMKVFTLNDPKNDQYQIDVMVLTYIDFEQAYKNRETGSIGNVKINIASIKDLIKLKKISARPIDLNDIEVLREIEKIRKEKKT